jgi:hypothetical protein
MWLFINRTIVIIFNGFLGLVAAVFFLGGKEEFLELKKDFFIGRFLAVCLIGVLFAIALFVINFILSKLKIVQIPMKDIFRFFMFSIIVTTVCVFMGTVIFWYSG